LEACASGGGDGRSAVAATALQPLGP